MSHKVHEAEVRMVATGRSGRLRKARLDYSALTSGVSEILAGMKTFCLLTLGVIGSASELAQATEPLLPPSAGSDAVLAMRSESAGELRLEYRQEAKGKPARNISVGISDTYHYVADGQGLTVHDYKLRRIFQVRPKGLFVNDSLYAEVWFRAMELRNRLMLAQAMAKAGITPPKSAVDTSDPFWIESALGAMSPEAPQPDLQQVDAGTRVRWLVKGDEVAAVRYESEPVPEEIRNRLRRFWPTFTQVHPRIAEALASSGRMPAELWVKQKPFGKEPVIAHWTLVSSHWEARAHYPLPSGLASLLNPSNEVDNTPF